MGKWLWPDYQKEPENVFLNLIKVKNDHRSKFSNLSNWKEEAWKNQGFNGIILHFGL